MKNHISKEHRQIKSKALFKSSVLHLWKSGKDRAKQASLQREFHNHDALIQSARPAELLTSNLGAQDNQHRMGLAYPSPHCCLSSLVGFFSDL